MAHIIFLVHGMGVYGKVGADGKYKPDSEGWFKDADGELKDIYENLVKPSAGKNEDFDNRFVLKHVEYDSILERYRNAWEKQAADWDKLGVGSAFVEALKTFMQGNKDSAFFWTHVVDVALYMASTVRVAVQTHVATQIAEALLEVEAAGKLDEWSVIAHSLGTAATHHALDRLGELSEKAAELAAARVPAPRVVCMAANVSRVLTYPADVPRLYGPSMAPSGSPHPDRYISCNHRLDPFTLVEPFRPDTPDWITAAYSDLSQLDVYYLGSAVQDWLNNVADFGKFAAVVPHGFAHYMRQPKVAHVLWPLLCGELVSEFGQTIENAVRAKYVGDRDDALAATLKAKLEAALPQVKDQLPKLRQLQDLLKLLLPNAGGV